MLNEEKIILMTKLAIYEKGEGKKEIPMSRYYRNDYVGVHMLYTFLSVTAGYVLLFALYIARDVENFLSSLTTMDLKKFLFTALAIYICAELFFLFVTWVLYRRRFKKNRQHLNEYYGNLKKLKKLQKKEQDAAMKMVEGKEAEAENAPKEDAGEDGMFAEDSEEDDIFREPEQQGYFRRRKAGRAGKNAGSKSGEEFGEDMNPFDGEEADLYDEEDLGSFDGEEADLYDEEDMESFDREEADSYGEKDLSSFGGKEADSYGEEDLSSFGGREADSYGEEDMESFGGEEADPYGEKDPGLFAAEEDSYDEEDTDPYGWEGDAEEEPGEKSGTVQTQVNSPNSEQNPDPDLALEQALKKVVLDNSEENEEDEDGFTFSS